MSDKSILEKVLSTGNMLVFSSFLFFVFAWLLHPLYPEGYWFASVVFILFASEHLYNHINRSDTAAFQQLRDSMLLRPIAFGVPAAFTVMTWGFVDAL